MMKTRLKEKMMPRSMVIVAMKYSPHYSSNEVLTPFI